ncbi:MAG: LysR family transcriptional regulator [Granulosicoccaceae bacterium]
MYSVEDLTAFVTIVEEGSVTGAAKSMDLDPATVSRRLSKLEAKLGVILIKRSTRRMAITAEGSLFHTHAVAAIRLLRQAEQSVATTTAESSTAAIAIAAPSWLLQKLLVPAMQKLSAAQSGALELIATDTCDMLTGQAALSLSVGLYPVASEYQVCLMKNHTVLCASPSFLARSGSITAPIDLQARTCIASHGNRTWNFSTPTGATPSIHTGEDVLCDDDETLLALAKSGQGVVALNSVHAAAALAASEIIEVLPGQLREGDRNIYLHCDSLRYSMDGVEECYKAIQKTIANQSSMASENRAISMSSFS